MYIVWDLTIQENISSDLALLRSQQVCKLEFHQIYKKGSQQILTQSCSSPSPINITSKICYLEQVSKFFLGIKGENWLQDKDLAEDSSLLWSKWV